MFDVQNPVPDGLRSRVVYKFACAGCNACYVGETARHFSKRAREHLASDRASHIFKHLQNSEHCRALRSLDCFHILDHEKAFHIQRQQPLIFESTITPCKSKIILIILTLSRFMFILLSPFIIISIFVYLL